MENALGQVRFCFFMNKFCLVLLCFLLTGCLVPDKYQATLEVSNKAYSLEFIGEMRIMVLYTDDYKSGSLNLSPHAEPLHKQVVTEFQRVIKERSNARIEVEQKEPVLFRTAFAYTSPYDYPEASGLFNFNIEDSVLTITSRHISPEDKTLLAKHNIPSQGTLCIKTLGEIIESNAQIHSNAFNRCNTWTMKNLDEGIKMVIKFQDPIVLKKK